jgi:predicted nucleic acid-binding protein
VSSVYIDTNIFLYAMGGESRHRKPCREVVDAIRRGRIVGETSVTTLEEVVHHRRRRGDDDAVARGRQVAQLCSIHPLDRELSLAALDLMERHPHLETGDAIHMATAAAQGVTRVLTADRDFDDVPGIERLDPLDDSAMASLLSD